MLVNIAIDATGQSRLETNQVASPLMGIDIIGKGKNLLFIGTIILNGDLDIDTAALSADIYRLLINRRFIGI